MPSSLTVLTGRHVASIAGGGPPEPAGLLDALPLVKLGIGGADKLLPATFLVIVGTVAIYGLAADPLAGALGLREPEPEKSPKGQSP